MDDKNKARMATILLATAFRRWGITVDPQTTRIADWQGEAKSVVVLEDAEGVHILPFEGEKGNVPHTILHKDEVRFLTGKRVPVLFGMDVAHNIVVVHKLDDVLEAMYKVFVEMGKGSDAKTDSDHAAQ